MRRVTGRCETVEIRTRYFPETSMLPPNEHTQCVAVLNSASCSRAPRFNTYSTNAHPHNPST